jgi:cation transporter-like permease
MSLDSELIRALAALTFGIACFPFAFLFLTMFFAGRVVTQDDERSDLGTLAGVFFLMVGVVLLEVSVLSISTWHDLEPDRGMPPVAATVINIVGVVCILIAMGLAVRIGPVLWRYIRIFWRLEREGQL